MKKSYLVIGLGRFGSAVAKQLNDLGNEVLVLDESAEAIQHIADEVTQAVTGDARDEVVLRSVGARNFDCAIVAVASNLEASVLITVLLKEAGVKRIVAKAQSDVHARILERIGADEVVLPERDMGVRLAQRMSAANVIDFIGVSDEFSILEIKAPPSWVGKTLKDLNLRAHFLINVLAIRHGCSGVVDVTPAAGQVIEKDDALIIIGSNENVSEVVGQV